VTSEDGFTSPGVCREYIPPEAVLPLDLNLGYENYIEKKMEDDFSLGLVYRCIVANNVEVPR
jgi:hypothetical protein